MKDRIVKTSDNRLAFMCPGCKFLHSFDARWKFNNNFKKPTFTPSLLVQYGKNKVCHSFITDGNIQFLSDCTHSLKDKTVALKPWREIP